MYGSGEESGVRMYIGAIGAIEAALSLKSCSDGAVGLIFLGCCLTFLDGFLSITAQG